MVNFKVENATIRAKVQKKNRPEDWVVVEDQHEAIVSQEEFRLAGESIRKVKNTGVKKFRPSRCPITAAIAAAGCGRPTGWTSTTPARPSSTKRTLYAPRSSGASLTWRKSLRQPSHPVGVVGREVAYIDKTAFRRLRRELRRERATLERALAQLAQNNLRVYERYRAGELEKEAFLSQKEQLLEQRVRKESALAGISHQLEELERTQRKEAHQEASLQKVLP